MDSRFPEHLANKTATPLPEQATQPVRDGNTRPHRPPEPGSGRLEVRCPNCHTPTQVALDTALTDLTCDCCGSHFSLVDQSDATRMAPTLSKLGRFELIERLGVGGFGSVWKARDKQLDRTVAIKLPRASAMSLEDQEKFFREARAAAQLSHPNIVRVHEVGRDGENIYIVSDFVRGATLSDWVSVQKLTTREAAELCAKMADALQHAHEQGVVHRDLKPANIILDFDGQPHLMDFGLARRETGEVTMTIDGQVLGTPAYMSPEQAQGESHIADRRSDVYSLGVILFQLLTGEIPFRGNIRMLIKQVIHDEPPSPRKLNANISRDLETITLKCLQKSPAKRYQTADELAKELRRFLGGEPIQARPVSRVERGVRWVRRNRLLAVACAVAVVALMGGTVASALFAVDARSEASNATAALVSETAARQEAELQKTRADEQALISQAALVNETAAREDAQKEKRRADVQGSLARKRLYAAQINLAHQAWEVGDPARVLTLLDGLRPKPDEEDLRTFEWRYLWQRCHEQCRLILRGHTNRVTSVAYSPDGKYLASGSFDRTVRLWNSATGDAAHLFRTANSCLAVTFSPDGEMLAASDGRLVRLWNVSDCSDRATINAGGDIHALAFSPDGSALAVGTANVTVWDVKTAKQLVSLPRHGDSVTSIAFSSDSKMLARGGSKGVRVWRWDGAATSDEVHHHSSTQAAVAFSPDSQALAFGSGYISDVKSWQEEPRAGRRLQTSRAETYRNLFSPDGKSVASARVDHCALVWDPISGKVLGNYAHAARVFAEAFSPDGGSLATAGDDRVIKIWDLAPKEDAVRKESARSSVDASLAFLPSSDELLLGVSGTDFGIVLWNARTGKEQVLGERGNVAISPDGKTMALCWPGKLTLWDVASCKERTVLSPVSGIQDLMFSPDGIRLAAATGNSFMLWDTNSGERLSHPLGQHVASVVFSPDDKLLATAGNTGMITKRDPFTGKLLRNFAEKRNVAAWSAAVSPDSHTLAVGYEDGIIQLIDVDTWEARATLSGHTDRLYSLAFFSDGRTLFSCSNDGSIRFWDVEAGQERMTFREFGFTPRAVAISADGNAVAAASQRGAIKVWRASTAPEALTKKPSTFETNYESLKGIAWELATSPNDKERDGQRALRLALQACAQCDYKDPTIVYTLAAAYAEVGEFDAAVKWAQEALDLLPENVGARTKQWYTRALENYRAKRPPEPNPARLNAIAWQLATSASDTERDGKRAVELALKACEMTDYKDPAIIDTLAAAYAEVGDFEAAAKWSQKAIDLLPENADGKIKEALTRALRNYKAETPMREKTTGDVLPEKYSEPSPTPVLGAGATDSSR